jgi:hypothetical protein
MVVTAIALTFAAAPIAVGVVIVKAAQEKTKCHV